MKRRYFISGVTIGFLFFIFSYYGFSFMEKHSFGRLRSKDSPYVFTGVGPEITNLQNSFVNIAKAVKPSVVQITTEKVVTQRYWDPFGNFEGFFRSPLDDFFRTPRRQQQQQPKTFERKQQGLGSGFIVDEKGYIITNNHVIRDVDKILVTLNDGTHKYEAKVVGSDPKTDLALIKIEAKEMLPAVKLGDSESLQPGEWVMAIGNPMGLSATVTVGVISAKGRSGFHITQYEDFIQTDAAINPGNSGGPLVNINAEVIGINTFIVSPQVGQNLGFAIPVNMAKHVFTQLRDKGKVVRGYLGIVHQPLDEDLAKSFGLKNTKGALVLDVMPDTPASSAGIKTEDVILVFDGKTIEDTKELQMKVADTPVGKKVKIIVWRDKKEVQLNLVVGEMPSDEQLASITEDSAWRGIKVAGLSDDIKEKYKVEGTSGVVVVSVEPGSPADEVELTVGTIILAIEGKSIKGLSDYKDVVRKLSSKSNARIRIKKGANIRVLLLKGEK